MRTGGTPISGKLHMAAPQKGEELYTEIWRKYGKIHEHIIYTCRLYMKIHENQENSIWQPPR